MLRAEVEVALGLSRFDGKCDRHTVAFFFDFKLEDPPTDSVLPPAVRFVPPNRFDLVFRRVKPNNDPIPK